MDVRCEQCNTAYEFDDSRVTDGGVAVRCGQCNHVFMLRRRSGGASPAPKTGEFGQLPTREWKVRHPDGRLESFLTLAPLQSAIGQGRVPPDADISLSGERWRKLAEISELAAFFPPGSLGAGALAGPVNPVTSPFGEAATPGETPVLMSPVVSAAEDAVVRSPTTSSDASASVEPSAREEGLFAVPRSFAGEPVAPMPAGMGPGAPLPITAPTPAAPSVSSSKSYRPGSTGVMSAERKTVIANDDDLRAAGLRRRSGGAGKTVLIVLLLAGLGAGAYFGWDHLKARLQEQAPPSPTPPSPAPTPEAASAAPDAPGTQGMPEAAEASAGTAAEEDSPLPGAPTPATNVPPEPSPARGPQTPTRTAQAPADDFDALMTQGDRLRRRERSQAALQAYERASELQPTRAEPIAGRGLVMLDLGRAAEGEAAFLAALRFNPRYAVAVMGLAEAYRAQGKNQQAVEYYRKYLELFPSGPESHVARRAIETLQE